MSLDGIKKVAVLILGEAYASTSMPGSVTLAKVLDRAEQRQKEKGIAVLTEELRKGRDDGVSFGESDADNFIQMLLRFQRAVEDGSARRNLRLLAQMIVGLKRHGILEPDRFRKYASRLQDLSRDELIVLAHAYRVAKVRVDVESTKTAKTNEGLFTQALVTSLAPIMSRKRFYELAGSLIRTGLLEPRPGLDGMSYQETSELLELGSLASLEMSAATDDETV